MAVARQGVLPWPEFWSSTKPFGTPFAPMLLKWGLWTVLPTSRVYLSFTSLGFSVIVILAPPAGDAFNLLVDLASYPTYVRRSAHRAV
jgi:hypothetical protein